MQDNPIPPITSDGTQYLHSDVTLAGAVNGAEPAAVSGLAPPPPPPAPPAAPTRAIPPEQLVRIPAELRERPQWALAGSDKAPLSVDANGELYNAASTRPQEWLTFERAVQVAQKNAQLATRHTDRKGIQHQQVGLNIGFLFSPADPFTCIDLDVKDDTPQEHLERHEKIVAEADSYTELSRSGRGRHIWVRGNIGPGRKRDGVEVYSQERFIICTGNVWKDQPIADRQDMLDKMVSKMPPAAAAAPEIDLSGELRPNLALAERAAEDTGELGRLWREGWTEPEERYPSQSEADFALVKMLLRECATPAECWATFRLSALGKRKKARTRSGYAKSTLAKAQQALEKDAQLVSMGKAAVEAMRMKKNQSNTDNGRFRLLTDKDLSLLPGLRWIVKNIIPDTGIGAIYGDSGTYKSFLTLDLLAHISNGCEWFGRKIKAAPAVYIPFEGQGGIPTRVRAWREAQLTPTIHEGGGYSISPNKLTTNIAFIMEPLNLQDPTDREKLVATLTESGWAGGVLCIDTLAHASNGIDENSSAMGAMIGILRDLQQRLGGVILVVHHSGKDQSKGMRGWSGVHAAMDFIIECSRDKQSGTTDAKFTLSKVKDGTDGLSYSFQMKTVLLEKDDDGDWITSLVVEPVLEAPAVEAAGEAAAADGARDDEDDNFIELWIREQVTAGNHPSKNSLKGQRAKMKEEKSYPITQARILAAVERLLAEGRLINETRNKSKSGNPWLRPADPSPAPAAPPPPPAS